MLDAVERLSPKWKRLAIKLHIDKYHTEIIQKNNPGDVQNCLIDALEEWLRQNYDSKRYGMPSWRTLAKSVRSLDQKLFQEIIKEHQVTN